MVYIFLREQILKNYARQIFLFNNITLYNIVGSYVSVTWTSDFILMTFIQKIVTKRTSKINKKSYSKSWFSLSDLFFLYVPCTTDGREDREAEWSKSSNESLKFKYNPQTYN